MVKPKKKQPYKALTQWQEKKAIAWSKKGWNQDKIARSLKVAKKRVSRVLITKKVGKRQAKNEFWKDVKTFQKWNEVSWKTAKDRVYHLPYWGKKRAARSKKMKYMGWKEFYAQAKRDALTQKERDERYEEMEDEFYFGTPL